MRTDKKIEKELKVLIDTGATSCYIKEGIYQNKKSSQLTKEFQPFMGLQ